MVVIHEDRLRSSPFPPPPTSQTLLTADGEGSLLVGAFFAQELIAKAEPIPRREGTRPHRQQALLTV